MYDIIDSMCVIIGADWLRDVVAWTTRRVFGDDALARVILASRPCASMLEYAEWIRRRDDYRRLFTQQVSI